MQVENAWGNCVDSVFYYPLYKEIKRNNRVIEEVKLDRDADLVVRVEADGVKEVAMFRIRNKGGISSQHEVDLARLRKARIYPFV